MESKINKLVSTLNNVLSELESLKKKKSFIEKIENADSKSDLSKFKIEDLKKYCKLNDIEVDGIKTKYVNAIWEYIQYEWYYPEDESDESDESDPEDDDDDDQED